MKKPLAALAFCLSAFLAASALAQFTGPSAAGQPSTVAAVGSARLGSYVTLTGHVVGHQRENYYTFRDDTGDIRVEISSGVWQGRKVGPTDQVRIMGEVERSFRGRYIDVKTLELL